MVLPDETMPVHAATTVSNENVGRYLVRIPPHHRALIRGNITMAQPVPELVVGPSGREKTSRLKCIFLAMLNQSNVSASALWFSSARGHIFPNTKTFFG